MEVYNSTTDHFSLPHIDHKQLVHDDFSPMFAMLNIIHHVFVHLVHIHQLEDQQYLDLDIIDQHKDLPL
jgi:hypothetical protein